MSRSSKILFLILITSFAILSLRYRGTSDVDVWLDWIGNSEKYGITLGYKINRLDYPPLTNVILSIVSKFSASFQVSKFIGIKASLLLFLGLTSLTCYLFTRNIVITSLLQLSLTLNSAALGYLDVYFAPFLILSLFSLRKGNMFLFSVLYTLSCFIKWQPIVIAPFIVIYIFNFNSIKDINKVNMLRILKHVLLPVTIVLALLFLFFGMEIAKSFYRGFTNPMLSGNALNLNWIVTYFLHVFYPSKYEKLLDDWRIFRIVFRDFGSYSVLIITGLSKLFLLVFYGFALLRFIKCRKSFENLILYSLLGFISYFIFNTGVHENHLFTACILSAILYSLNNRFLAIFLILAFVFNINLFLLLVVQR